jgi:cyclic pyranopterin phosphate synthase
MPAEGVSDIGHESILGFEEIERVVRAAVSLGFRKFRLTGGEPLVRRGVVRLTARIAAVSGVDDLAVTSNGILFPRMAAELKSAGLRRVNISLDSLRAERYRYITRGGSLADAIAGIRAAERAGLCPIRVNVVVIRGFNDDEIPDFARLTLEHPWDVRFIELMPVGETGGFGLGAKKDGEANAPGEAEFAHFSADEFEALMRGFEPVSDGAGRAEVARYYRYKGAPGRVGLISPLSRHFCGDCNKLRLTADGKLKTCLHSNREMDIRPALRAKGEAALCALLAEAVLSKEERHLIGEGEAPVRRGMSRIGG